MKIILIILIVFTSISCCCNDCNEDVLYKKNFNEYISLVKRTSHDTLLVQDIRNAVIFLNATTGIEAEQFDIENGVFYTKEALTNNINKWENWYRNNKCHITTSKADSLLKKYK